MNDPIPMSTHAASPGLSTHEQRKATRPLRWWYEMLADRMIAEPQASQSELATHFGRTESTISLIINSDAFKAYYRQRRAEFTEKLDDAIRSKLFKVADTSLDNLLSSLEKKRDSVPIEMLHRTTDMALKNLGYGAQPAANTNVIVAPNVNVAVSVEDLQAAREALRRNQTAIPSPPPLIDVGDVPPDDDPSPSPTPPAVGE